MEKLANAETMVMVSLLKAHLAESHRDMVIEASTTVEQLDLDSLGLLEWVYDIEEYFDLELDDSQLELLHQLKSLGEMFSLFNVAIEARVS